MNFEKFFERGRYVCRAFNLSFISGVEKVLLKKGISRFPWQVARLSNPDAKVLFLSIYIASNRLEASEGLTGLVNGTAK